MPGRRDDILGSTSLTPPASPASLPAPTRVPVVAEGSGSGPLSPTHSGPLTLPVDQAGPFRPRQSPRPRVESSEETRLVQQPTSPSPDDEEALTQPNTNTISQSSEDRELGPPGDTYEETTSQLIEVGSQAEEEEELVTLQEATLLARSPT